MCQCLQWVERWRWHLRLKRVQFSFHAMANIWWAQIHPHERLRESYKEPNSKITIGIVCTSKQCREKASRANSQPANWTRKIHHAIHVVRNEIESREGKTNGETSLWMRKYSSKALRNWPSKMFQSSHKFFSGKLEEISIGDNVSWQHLRRAQVCEKLVNISVNSILSKVVPLGCPPCGHFTATKKSLKGNLNLAMSVILVLT